MYKYDASRYENYYEKTETLLDRISTWYGHKEFQDSIMETDAYFEYELAKEELLKNERVALASDPVRRREEEERGHMLRNT